MLTSISIQCFRCFRDLAVDGLERVNLIAGRNNVGKSTLLEALHLHCHPNQPHLWVKVNSLRGVDSPLDALAEVAEWLFFAGKTDLAIEIDSRDADGIERSTDFRMLDAAASRANFPEVERELATALPAAAGSDAVRLLLRYRYNGTDHDSVAVASTRGGHAGVLSGPTPGDVPNLYLASMVSNEARDIRHFGELEKSKRLADVLPALHHVEPRVQRLSLVPFAGRPRIHADIDGFDKLIPLSQVGEGTRRLLSMLLAIAVAPGGIVFIDEIENGLHYSVQTQVWSAIAEAARTHDVQVFATTHSWECLRSAHEAFADADDFRMHRLDRIDDEIEATTYDAETLEAALLIGAEVR